MKSSCSLRREPSVSPLHIRHQMKGQSIFYRIIQIFTEHLLVVITWGSSRPEQNFRSSKHISQAREREFFACLCYQTDGQEGLLNRPSTSQQRWGRGPLRNPPSHKLIWFNGKGGNKKKTRFCKVTLLTHPHQRKCKRFQIPTLARDERCMKASHKLCAFLPSLVWIIRITARLLSPTSPQALCVNSN